MMASNKADARPPSVGFRRRFQAVRCLALLLALAAVVACQKPPAIGADIAARIDGEEIHVQQFEAYLRANVDGAETSLEDEVQCRLFEQFLDEQLLIRLAIERGLVEPEISQRQAVDFLLRSMPDDSSTEAEIEAYYQAHRSQFERPEEVHLRQILVGKREDAAAALAALDEGQSFVEVAARFSQAPNAQLGGDQGRLSRDDLTSAFADTIFDLEPGEVTDIIAVDYGFHLFQVVDRFPPELAPLEKVTEEIQQTLRRQRIDETVQSFIQEARERYNVEIFPANFPFDCQGTYSPE